MEEDGHPKELNNVPNHLCTTGSLVNNCRKTQSFYSNLPGELPTRSFSIRGKETFVSWLPTNNENSELFFEAAFSLGKEIKKNINFDTSSYNAECLLADTHKTSPSLASKITPIYHSLLHRLKSQSNKVLDQKDDSKAVWALYKNYPNAEGPMRYANEPEGVLEKLTSTIGRKLFISLCVYSSYLFAKYGNLRVENQDRIANYALYRKPNKPAPLELDQKSHRPLITISNHTTTLDDPLSVASVVPPSILSDSSKTRWIVSAKDICFRAKIAYFFALCKCIPIERGGGVFQPSMSILQQLLSHGEWVHFFPEGRANFDPIFTGRDAISRTPLSLLPLRRGVAFLAFQSALRGENPIILPYTHAGTPDCKPGGGFLPINTKKTICAKVGTPIEITDIVDSYSSHLQHYLLDQSPYFPLMDDYIHKISDRFHVSLQTLFDDTPSLTPDRSSQAFWTNYIRFYAENEFKKHGNIAHDEQAIQAIQAELWKARMNARPSKPTKILFPQPRNFFDAPDVNIGKDNITPNDLYRKMVELEELQSVIKQDTGHKT